MMIFMTFINRKRLGLGPAFMQSHFVTHRLQQPTYHARCWPVHQKDMWRHRNPVIYLLSDSQLDWDNPSTHYFFELDISFATKASTVMIWT